MAGAGVAVDEDTLDEEIGSSPVPVLVEFTAGWCPPCRVMAPVLEAVAAQLGDALRILTLDADDHPAVVARHRVLALPTMLVFRDGVVVERLVGARSKTRLLQDLAHVLS
jgi:thioredoxin 1